MVRKIVKYGDPVLETVCDPVPESEFGSPQLHALVQDMFHTMYDARGVGLAAPQVGIPKRLTVIDCTGGEADGQRHVLINPEIVSKEGRQLGEEGCLSIPGFQEKVARPAKVRTRARTEDGEWFELEARGTARAGNLSRERSSERRSVPPPRQQAQAQDHQAQDPQPPKARRVGLGCVSCSWGHRPSPRRR